VTVEQRNTPGLTVAGATGENPNPFYRIVDAGKPIIAPNAVLPEIAVRSTWTVDVATVAGGAYVIAPVQSE
jgi:hypothetical protein